MQRKPEYYKTPLRNRADIIAFIISTTSQRVYDYRPFPLCFNVKVYGRCNLSFDNLLKLWRENEGDHPATHDENWLAAAKEKYEETGEETLFDWGQESACESITNSDAFRTLWNGIEVDVDYSFEGRSGGWLSINRFERNNFNDRDCHIEETLKEMSFPTLRKLYQLIVMLKHDVAHPEKEIEFQASFTFFANICSDIEVGV